MARYSVAWNAKNKTLTIGDYTAKSATDKDNVGDVFGAVVGEIPDAAPHPETGTHLKNLAATQGVDDYQLVTVVNDTDHDGFDAFVKEADKAYVKIWEAAEKAKSTGPAAQDPGQPETKNRNVAPNTKDGAKEGPTA